MQLSGLNLSAGFWDIFLAQILQGVALSFLFIPLMALAMARIQPENMGNATSIFNLMRNIGGSVGIAIMTTFLSRRTQIHQNHLVANVTAGNLLALRMFRGMQANFYAHGTDGVTAARKSIAAMYDLVQQQAAMLAFVEAFWVMGVVFLLMIPFLPLLQYSRHKRPATLVPVTSKSQPTSPEAVEEEVPEEEHELMAH